MAETLSEMSEQILGKEKAATVIDAKDLAFRPVGEIQPVIVPARRLDQTPTGHERPYPVHSDHLPGFSAVWVLGRRLGPVQLCGYPAECSPTQLSYAFSQVNR